MSADWTALDEIGGRPATRASAGYEDRAAMLQELVRDAHAYLTQGLGTGFAPLVVVADPTDWDRGGDDAPPYGMPYASDDGFEVVIPAEPRENFLVDAYAAHGTRESAERFADLIAVHELGHLHVREMGLDLPPGWLVEFMATYLASCFLVARRPEDASLWYALARAHAEGTNPEHRSLEVLDELYFGVGPDNYIWYQDALTLMVDPKALPRSHGKHFPDSRRSRWHVPTSAFITIGHRRDLEGVAGRSFGEADRACARRVDQHGADVPDPVRRYWTSPAEWAAGGSGCWAGEDRRLLTVLRRPLTAASW